MLVAGSCDYNGFYGTPKGMLLDGVFMERRHFRNAGIAIGSSPCLSRACDDATHATLPSILSTRKRSK